LGQLPDIRPTAQAVIDAGVVDRIKASIRTIDFVEKRQQMDATKHTLQRAFQQRLQLLQSRAAKAVDISDQLNLVFHSFDIHKSISQ
jgi:hypothetical protein